MRISGITIPENKRLEIGLTAVFGIGRKMAQQVLDSSKIDRGIRPKDLSTEQENRIRKVIEGLKIEGDLKREVAGNIKRYKDIASYRGVRHSRGMPVRGQRTKTNQRTRKGNTRKTMGSGRVKAEKT